MREKCTARKGFTLIELLVVIAIIAILAAILFPVFNKVRENTRRTTCMQQMHEIGVAVKLYREDTGKYPPILSAFPYYLDTTATPPVQKLYDGAPSHTPLDIDQVLISHRPLMGLKSTVTGKGTFLCPDHLQANPTATTSAVFPPGVPLTGTVLNQSLQRAAFYSYDSYDVGPALNANYGATQPFTYELHYSTDWTGKVGASDPQNQMKYPNPPESSTVVTWCTYHCAVNNSGIIPVLMLSGNVKPAPANQFATKGPLQFVP